MEMPDSFSKEVAICRSSSGNVTAPVLMADADDNIIQLAVFKTDAGFCKYAAHFLLIYIKVIDPFNLHV